jgi:drug/metabolite transporter (DMT)-like permease
LRVLAVSMVNPLLKAINRDRSPIIVNTAFCLISVVLIAPWTLYILLARPDALGTLAWADNALLSGSIFAVSFMVYGWSIGKGDVNLLTPLVSLTFVFVYFTDLIAGNRGFGWLPLAGIVLVTVGVTLLNLSPKLPWRSALNPLNILRQPGAWGVLLFAVAMSVTRIIDKDAAGQAEPVIYATLANTPIIMLGTIALAWQKRIPEAAQVVRGRLGLLTLAAAVGISNYLLLLASLRYFAPSTVEPVTQLGLLITVFMATWWFKEPLHYRWLAAIIMIAGSALIIIG